MYTIGEFSAITGISKKTLRYYDEIGVLKPDSIKENGYRQYNKDQIETADFILKLRGFGIGLTDIWNILSEMDELKLNSILDVRIEEIKDEINTLHNQQKSITKYRNKKADIEQDYVDFRISERMFDSGYALVFERYTEDISQHDLISEFYDFAALNQYQVSSNHYFRKLINTNEEKEKIQIFAYVDKRDNDNTLMQFDCKKTIEIFCPDINKRSVAYEKLITHMKSNNLPTEEFIEEYIMDRGKLGISICGVIE